MLEKIKSWGLAALGIIAGILIAVVYALQGRLAAKDQQLQTEKAKEGLADALHKQATDAATAKQASADFNALAESYEKSKPR